MKKATKRKTRVLILSEGFGSGHTQAGYALAAGMKRLCPEIQTRVLELGSFLNPTVAPWIQSAYRITLNATPSLVGMLYRQKYEKPVGRLTGLALHKMFYHHAFEVIHQLKPDLIVCTHPIPSAIVSRLKMQGLDMPLYTVITDYDAHSSWISSGVDRYFVSTPTVKELLIRRGIGSEQIHVTGIPVHPDFWSKQEKESARRELGLQDMPTVLIMGGGWGLLFKDELMDMLAQWKDRVQFVCCLGSNSRLVDKLRQHPGLCHPNITILGHTREVSKWMDASDLLITKPGGMTCTEALAKGLPMLFFESIPGQEEKNCEFFVTRGLGEKINSSEVLNHWFEEICTDRMSLRSSVVTGGYSPDRCARNIALLATYKRYGHLSPWFPLSYAQSLDR